MSVSLLLPLIQCEQRLFIGRPLAYEQIYFGRLLQLPPSQRCYLSYVAVLCFGFWFGFLCVQFCLFLVSFVRHLTVVCYFCTLTFVVCLTAALSVYIYIDMLCVCVICLWHIFHTPRAFASCLTAAHFIKLTPASQPAPFTLF